MTQIAIARADRYHTTVAVFIVNIDGFQKLNETHGHNFGDQVKTIRGVGYQLAVPAQRKLAGDR